MVISTTILAREDVVICILVYVTILAKTNDMQGEIGMQ